MVENLSFLQGKNMSNINTFTQYADFHTPEIVLLVNGKKLTKEGIDISEVMIEQILNGASTFTFTIPQALDDKFVPLHEGAIAFGDKIEISLGYKDKLFPIITGLITSLSWGFDEDNYLDLIVEGYDYLFLLMKNEKFSTWNDRSDSDIIKEIAQRYPFKNIEVNETNIIHTHIRQEGESDFNFLKRLIHRNGYEFFIEGENFICRNWGVDKESMFSLKLGRELLDFSPKIDISQQISEVKVIGWDPNSKKEIIAIATEDDIKQVEQEGKSGAQIIQAILNENVIHQVKAPIQDADVAKALAISMIQESAYKILRGECKAIGLPELRPGQVIELESVSELFSRKYYVEKVTHEIGDDGYETTFSIKGSTYNDTF
jgi:phage protein D